MRPFPLIAVAAFLMAGIVPAAGHADGMPPAPFARPACHCPAPVVRHVRQARRIVHYRARRTVWRRVVRRAPLLALAPPLPIYFNWVIPSARHPGYDRAMVLLGRSPAVSGHYTDDPGMPTVPMVVGVAPYQYAASGAVFQYDTMTGEYIQLSQADAARTVPLPGPAIPLTP